MWDNFFQDDLSWLWLAFFGILGLLLLVFGARLLIDAGAPQREARKTAKNYEANLWRHVLKTGDGQPAE